MRSELKPNWTFTGPRMEQATVLLVPVLMAHEIPLCEYAVEKTAQNSKVEPPDPNADLYAAIPWAKSVGLELKQGEGAWVYQCAGKFYCQFAKGWTSQHQQHSSCGHPTRTAALASPPPKPETSPTVDPHCPPDVLAAKALLDELAEVAYEADKIEGSGPWSSLSDKGRESWRRKALAVARRLLKKEPCEKGIDAVSDALWEGSHEDAVKAYNRAQLAELEGKA